MGSTFSLNGSPKHDWDIYLSPLREDFRQISARYDASQPLQIRIAGPTSLNCTIEVGNAVITVEDNGHHMNISGNNNTIRVTGNQVRVRIEGNNNTITGRGSDAFMYTDDDVNTDEIHLALRESYDAESAPSKLELLGSPRSVSNAGVGDGGGNNSVNGTFQVIRLAYRAREIISGGSGDQTLANNVESVDSAAIDDSSIDPSSSEDLSNQGGVKRDAEDSDESKSKKTRAS